MLVSHNTQLAAVTAEASSQAEAHVKAWAELEGNKAQVLALSDESCSRQKALADAHIRIGVEKKHKENWGHRAGTRRIAWEFGLAVEVRHPRRAPPEAQVEPRWHDEPGPFFPGLVAEAALLLPEPALGKGSVRLFVDGGHNQLHLGVGFV